MTDATARVTCQNQVSRRRSVPVLRSFTSHRHTLCRDRVFLCLIFHFQKKTRSHGITHALKAINYLLRRKTMRRLQQKWELPENGVNIHAVYAYRAVCLFVCFLSVSRDFLLCGAASESPAGKHTQSARAHTGGKERHQSPGPEQVRR